MQKILSKGSSVWVHVSRDRERGGKIVDVDHSAVQNETLYGVKIYGVDRTNYYPSGKVRPMNVETIEAKDLGRKIPETATDPDVVRVLSKGGTKDDSQKNRLELIPVSGIEGIGRAMTFGAKKYADHNWAKGFNYSRLIGAAMRHLMAWTRGEDKDPESGLSHLDHLGACVVMLIAHETENLGTDDRRHQDGIPATGGIGGIK